MKILPASPWDFITSTKGGVIRFDARKTWEAGAFLVSTWAFVQFTLAGNLTEVFLFAYMGTWVGARFLRDREQRLTNASDPVPTR